MNEVMLGSLVIVSLIVGLSLGLLMIRQWLIPGSTVQVVVNDVKPILAQRGDKLLNALHAAGIGVPAACGGSGTCGLCRVTVTGDGAGNPQATERGILSTRERRDHVRLACQTSLRGDCAVEVPQEFLTAGDGLTGRIASARMLAPLIRELVVDLPGGEPLDYRAGDFMQISAPPFELALSSIELPLKYRDAWETSGWQSMHVESKVRVTRAYSLANRPEDSGRAVFNIRLAVPPAGREEEVPPGVVSSWLFSLSPGAEITLTGPFGNFHVHPGNREMVFVGGGVGMAPLRSMICQELARGSLRRIRYFYGARAAADLFYFEELTQLAREHANFSWTPALSEPAPGDRWTGASGFIHETLRSEMQAHGAPEECEYYLCGPPMMVSAVLATLERLGADQDAIFYDDFGA